MIPIMCYQVVPLGVLSECPMLSYIILDDRPISIQTGIYDDGKLERQAESVRKHPRAFETSALHKIV